MLDFIKNLFFTEKPLGDTKDTQQKLESRFGNNGKEMSASYAGISLRTKFLIAVSVLSVVLSISYFVAENNYYRVEGLYSVPLFVILGIPIFFSITKSKEKESQFLSVFLVWMLSIVYLFFDLMIAAQWNGCSDWCGMGSFIIGGFLTFFYAGGSILWIIVGIVKNWRGK